MIKKKISLDFDSFPTEIKEYITGREVYDTSCRSGCSTYYLKPGYYLKVGSKGTLIREAELTKLFYDLGFSPELMSFVSVGKDYMLTREAEGEDMLEYLDKPELVCRILAESLRELHSRSSDKVPISAQISSYRGLMSKSLPDDSSCFMKKSFEFAQKNFHLLKTDDLIHGDACLPNLIVKDGMFSSFIDFDAAGAGDRHIDLWWALWSLSYNFGTDKYTDLFLDFYGRDRYDPETLRLVNALECLSDLINEVESNDK